MTVRVFEKIKKGQRLPNHGAVIKCPNGHTRRTYNLSWKSLICHGEGCDGKEILKSEYEVCTRVTRSGEEE